MFNKIKNKNILYVFLTTITIYNLLILLFNGFPTNTEDEIRKAVKGNKPEGLSR